MFWWQYVTIFSITFVLTVFLTDLVRRLALRYKILDYPKEARKIHNKKIPLLGGLAIFCSFFLMSFVFKEQLLLGDLNINHWLGVFIGASLLMLGGFLDDKYNLKSWQQLIWPVLAIVIVIAGGVEIDKISAPGGSPIFLKQITILASITLSEVFLFFWLLAMTYTTKLLDGLDGLVSGLTVIGSLVIFLFTITTKYYQADIGLAALILAAASAGFLLLNWHPAKIFLGEGGSLLLGFLLGVLAIISGGKIAITLLVLALPILDLVWTIFRRLYNGKNPMKAADKKHLHHRFLALGWGQRRAVLTFYAFAVIFGLSGLFLQSQGKFFLLIVLFSIMVSLVLFFSWWERKQKKNMENDYNK